MKAVGRSGKKFRFAVASVVASAASVALAVVATPAQAALPSCLTVGTSPTRGSVTNYCASQAWRAWVEYRTPNGTTRVIYGTAVGYGYTSYTATIANGYITRRGAEQVWAE